MNFFGHAYVAHAVTEDPTCVLGAMLPDFAAMCGGRLVKLREDGLAEGVQLHHRTDRAFHESEAFRALLVEGASELATLGVRRGVRVAAAHVAIELFLDGELVGDAGPDSLYLRALRRMRSRGVRGRFELAPRAAERHWETLCDRLIEGGLPRDCRDPARVAARVAHALAARPRLALERAERTRLEECLPALRARVVRAAPDLLAPALAAGEAPSSRRAVAPSSARAGP